MVAIETRPTSLRVTLRRFATNCGDLRWIDYRFENRGVSLTRITSEASIRHRVPALNILITPFSRMRCRVSSDMRSAFAASLRVMVLDPSGLGDEGELGGGFSCPGA